jgi:hypothetical protein
LLLLIGGVGMIVGSLNQWLAIPHIRASTFDGTAQGGPGEISLVAGIALVVVGILLAIFGGALSGVGRRLLSQVATAAAGAGLGISIYYVVHIHSAGGQNAGLGWGLVVVLLACIAAMIGAIAAGLTARD